MNEWMKTWYEINDWKKLMNELMKQMHEWEKRMNELKEWINEWMSEWR